MRAACRAVLWSLGVQVRVEGRLAEGPALLVANHLSWLDIVVLLATEDVGFVAKREVADWPIIGRLARAIGAIFVDRLRKRDLLRSIPALEQELRAGRSVVLFPEGTTSDGRALLPFRPAMIEAAVRAEVPVVPVVVHASAYADASALCWIGAETLLANLPRVRATSDATFAVRFLAPILCVTSRKLASQAARSAMMASLPNGAVRAHPRRSTPSATSMIRIGRRLITTVALLIVAVASVLYLQVPHYDFPPPAPFHGRGWYNPYATGSPGQAWWRTNLHSHARAWGGVTSGRRTAAEVVTRYRQLGTQVVGVSGYHVDPEQREPGTFPVYEHGWNVAKAHRLLIGASAVSWFDVPFWTSAHAEQYVIDRVHHHADLIALAHPGLRSGHDRRSLPRLGNYELLEVLNHFLPPADSAWDDVLSAGRPVWLLANDDSHDVRGEGETGTNFTQVLAGNTGRSAIIEALRAGRAYGVRALDHRGTLHLAGVTMRGDTLRVELSGRVHAVRVVGQQGRLKRAWQRQSFRERQPPSVVSDTVVTLEAVAAPDDGYLRVVAEGPDEWLFTNPVVRSDSAAPAPVLATINTARTAWHRSVQLFVLAWLGVWGLAAIQPRSRRPLTPAPPVPAVG